MSVKLSYMDVQRLELLRELAERRSITEVARATYRTPSAVSQQLKVLERECRFAAHRAQWPRPDPDGCRARWPAVIDVAVALARANAVWTSSATTPPAR